MMMSKPNSEQEKEVEEAPAFAAPAATMKTGTVEDLERRLAMLGKDEGRVATTAAAAAPPTMKDAPAPPPTVQAPAPAPTAIKLGGGKNALLVRRNIFKKLKKR